LTRDYHPVLVCHQEIDARDRWRARNRADGWVHFFEHKWVHFHERRGLERWRHLKPDQLQFLRDLRDNGLRTMKQTARLGRIAKKLRTKPEESKPMIDLDEYVKNQPD